MHAYTCLHCIIVLIIPLENEIQGAVTENKLHNDDPVAQMLGDMEKLAGDLAYYHLKNCSGDFRYITIFGLIINYNDDSIFYKGKD